MSKTIEFYRHFNRLELSQDDPEVKAWFGQSFRAIGPYYDGKVTATGLSFKEQRFLLPELLGVEETDKDFRKSVNNFYDSLITKIGKDGLKLEVGLEDDNLPLSETNLPINVKDYVIYRHACKHPDVAENKESAEKSVTKKFYMVNPEAVSADVIKTNDLEDEAMGLYFKYKDDTIKVDQILTIMGKNIKSLKKEEKVVELKRLSVKNPNINEFEQKETLERFIKVCNDKDLESRFLIQELIGAQYLEKVGTAILIRESGEKLGDSMKEAIQFINNPKNSRTLNILKAQYGFKVKQGVFDVKQIDEPTVTQ